MRQHQKIINLIHIMSSLRNGAKKYAYRDMDGSLHITVAGVPKERC